MNEHFDIGTRVHNYGSLGTIIDFPSYYRDEADVEWDSGGVETVPVEHLRIVTPEQEAFLRS